MRPLMSLCMIVKNEEKVIGRCLDSVINIVDEIIIVDTGSTDNTKNIVKEFTTQLYDYEWENSFSAARNYSLSKANGDWILVLDADEYLDRENLKQAVEQIKNEMLDVDAYSVTFYNFTGNLGEKIIQHTSTRIFRNAKSIHYIRDIHEQVVKEEGPLRTKDSILNVYHTGYLNRTVSEKDKNKRNIPLVELELERSTNKAFDYFNLGNEYSTLGEVEKALEAYQNAFIHKDSFEYKWVPIAIVQIIICLIELQRYQEALQAIADAEQVWVHSPDFKCLQAQIYLVQNRYEDAKQPLFDLVENKSKYQSFIKGVDFLELFPAKFLGSIFEKERNYQKAVYYYSQAISFNHRDFDTLHRFYKILVNTEDRASLITFIKKQMKDKHTIDKYLLIRILLSLSQVDMVEILLQSWPDLAVTNGAKVKIYMLKGEFEKAYEVITLSTVNQLLQDNWIDGVDLLLIGLKVGSESFIKLLSQGNEEIGKLVDYIEGRETNLISTDLFILLLEKCIEINTFDLIDLLLNGNQHLSNITLLKIGNLFYKHQFSDAAIDLYEKVNEVQIFDAQAYVNIISELISIKNYEAAVQFILKALENDINDFQIYKVGINLFDQLGNIELRDEFLKLALYHYPDSHYLQNIKLEAIN